MDSLIEVLKKGDIDLEFKLVGTRPQSLTHAQVTQRAVAYALKEGVDKLSEEELDARFDQNRMMDEALGPFGLYLLGPTGKVVAHTEASIPTFNLVKDIAGVLLSTELSVKGLIITKIEVRCGGGELLPVQFVQTFDDTPDSTIEA